MRWKRSSQEQNGNCFRSDDMRHPSPCHRAPESSRKKQASPSHKFLCSRVPSCWRRCPDRKLMPQSSGMVYFQECLKEGCCLSNCLLAPGASCYRGECCRKCQVSYATTAATAFPMQGKRRLFCFAFTVSTSRKNLQSIPERV